MADHHDHPSDLRSPVSVTIPWRRTPSGKLWPLDKKNRYWPKDRWGQPIRPLDELPHGEAPGTGGKQYSVDHALKTYFSARDQLAAMSEKGAAGYSIPTITVTRNDSGGETGPHIAGRGAVQAAIPAALTLVMDEEILAVGAASILAVLSSPAFLAAVAIAGGFYLLWRGSRWWFANADSASAFVHETGDAAHGTEALVPPPPTPLLPPPPSPPMKADNPGFDPAAPIPAQPGFTPAPPMSHAPPETPHVTVSHVMESQQPARNSKRARSAARRADPEVVAHLKDDEWRAHHLLSLAALALAPDLVRAAEEAGWSRDDASNMAALPADKNAQRKLQQFGVNRPYHDNSHPGWRQNVTRDLSSAQEEFESESGAFRDPRTRAQEARKFLEQESRKLRKIMIHLDRITSLEALDDVQSS